MRIYALRTQSSKPTYALSADYFHISPNVHTLIYIYSPYAIKKSHNANITSCAYWVKNTKGRKPLSKRIKKNHTLDNREQNRPNKCKKTNFKVESNWRTSWNSKIPSLIVNACSTFFSNNFSSVVAAAVVVLHSVLFALPSLILVVTSLKSIHTNIFCYILVHGGNKHDLWVWG